VTPYTDAAWRRHVRGYVSKVVGVTKEPGYPGFCDVLMKSQASSFVHIGERWLDRHDPDSVYWSVMQRVWHPDYEQLAGILIRDPRNPHDTNAIEVHVPLLECRVGFLPAQLAAIIAPELDAGDVRYTVDVWAVPNLIKPEFPGVRCLLTLVTMS
jgi:hypothetical protein